MQINLTTLRSQKKQTFQEDLNPDDVLWSPPEYASFTSLIKASIQAQIVEQDVVVGGQLQVQAQLICGRCLGPYEMAINNKMQQVYSADVENIELNNDIRESLFIEIPTYPICKPECKGICAQCGANRNIKQCKCVQPTNNVRWGKLKELKSN